MDKKLEHLKDSMDHTVFKGLEFSEERKKNVYRSLKTERRHHLLKWVPTFTSIKAVWSVIACVVLLVGSLYFAFSTIKENTQGPRIRSGDSMFSKKQNGDPKYIVYFDAPESWSTIASLQKQIPFNLIALKYLYPLADRLPEAGTYVLEKNEPITVAATTAESRLKYSLKNDIRDLGKKVDEIKTKKQLSLEKPMLNNVMALEDLKEGVLQKIESESIQFNSIVIGIDKDWIQKLTDMKGIAAVEVYQSDKQPLEEQYPQEKTDDNKNDQLLPPEPVYAIKETTNDNVWSYSYHHLYHSTDNGLEWKEIKTLNIDSGTIANADFVEDHFIKLYVREDDQASLYLSSDNGKTWTKHATPFSENGQLFFLNSLTGWYLEETGLYTGQASNKLYRTSDGGIHWTVIATSGKPSEDKGTIPIQGVKTNLMFIDDQTGWFTSVEPGGTNAYLYKTDDGGENWREVQINIPESYRKSQNSIQGPYFFDRKNGFFVLNARYISGEHSAFVLYKTDDGGRSWQMTQPMDSPYNQEVRVDVTNDKAFITDGKTLFETKDMGVNWLKSGMVFDGQINRIVAPLSLNMIDDQHAVMLIREMTNLSRLLASVGEISHWQTVNVPSTDNHQE